MADEKITIKKSGTVSLNNTPELPIDGLPKSIQQYINAVCDIYHCPREFVTAAVLSTASTAVGKKIKINEGKYKNSLVLWFVLVARSGSNKSYPMKLVTTPLRKIDDELFAKYKERYDEWKKIPNKERNSDEPRCPCIVLDDCTDERRSEILFINNDSEAEVGDCSGTYGSKRGAIVIYPEIKGMFDSKNQYNNGGTIGVSKLLRLFDCEDIKVDRRNGFTMLIKDPFCNIIGDLQIGMLKPTFANELFMTNGLNQRFLFCVVENIEYPDRSSEILPADIERQWRQTIKMLYEGIYHDNFGGHHTLFRTTDGEVSLSQGADALYGEYYNELQKKKEKADSDYEAAIYSKLQIQVLRFAGIVHALEVAEEKGERSDYYSLHESTMAYAIRCMDYFEKMALLRDQSYGKKSNEVVLGSSFLDINQSSFQDYRNYVRMYNPGLKYNTLNDEDFCIKTGIVVNGMLTIGGLLMFGKLEKILEFNHDFIIDYIEIPGASIKEAHTRYTYRMQEQENIWDYFKAISYRLRTRLDNPYSPLPNGFAPDDESQMYCVREALVNFLAHADYFSEIHSTVRVYDNSIELQNPGSFPVDLKMVGLSLVSQPRNPNILRFFKLAKLSENGGYGIDKINEWKQLTGSEVTIKSSITYSEVKLLMPIKANQRQLTPNDIENGADNDVERKILALISVDNKISLKELAKKIEVPGRTLDRIITSMKGKGIIKRVGAARSGYWEIIVKIE